MSSIRLNRSCFGWSWLPISLGIMVITSCGPRHSRQRVSQPPTRLTHASDTKSDGSDLPTTEPKPAKADLPPRLDLAKVSYSDLKGWNSDKHGEALTTFLRSCKVLMRMPPQKAIGINPVTGIAKEWREPCKNAAWVKKKASAVNEDLRARRFFERYFTPYAASNRGDRLGRFTGYYNARLRASRKKSKKFSVPVYARPSDLVSIDLGAFFPKYKGERLWGRIKGTRMVPFDTRAEIYAGSLGKRAKVLLWASSLVDVFFAQVQGSATVDLREGKTTRIGVGGKNGHIYTAIGRVLIRDGELARAKVSMQSIRQWLLDHPAKAQGLLEANKAYIFFREYQGPGPFGSQGVVVTPGRTLAVDLRMIAHSVPIWLETEVPALSGSTDVEPWQRLMIAQDTGGAIRGPVRGDIYFGDSESAFARAGRMKGAGQYYLLLPNAIVVEQAEEEER